MYGMRLLVVVFSQLHRNMQKGPDLVSGLASGDYMCHPSQATSASTSIKGFHSLLLS